MRSDLYTAAREFAVYGLGAALMQAVSILLIPVYTRWLGVSDYGLLALLVGFQAVLVILAQAGLGSALFRSFYDYENETDQQRVIATTAALLLLLTAAVTGLALLLIGLFPHLPGRIGLAPNLARLVVFIAFFEGLNVLPLSVFRARRQALRYAATSLLVLLVRLGAIIYFVVVQEAGLTGVLYGMLIGASFSLTIGTAQIVRALAPNFSHRDVRNLLRFGLPLIPANLAGWGLAISGRYFLAYFATPADVGLYALAERFASVLQVLLVQPLFLLWLPVMLSIHRKPYARELFARILNYYAMAAMAFCLALALFAREVLLLLATPAFAPARHYIFPLALAIAVYGSSRLLNIGNDLARKSENGAVGIVSAVAVYFALNFWLTPRWGIAGLVAASAISYAVMSAVTYALAYRLYPLGYDWARVAGTVLLACALYAAGLLLELRWPASVWPVFAAKFLLLAAFPLLLLLLRIVDRPEYLEARGQLARLLRLLRGRLRRLDGMPTG